MSTPAAIPTTMRALVKHAEVGLRMEEQPVPEVGPNDLLIAIDKTAICGTDIHIWNWDDWARRTVPTPMTVGHEYVGRVAKVGSHVPGFEVGDRVSGEGHLTCGHCRNCRAGKRHLCRNTRGVGVNRPGAFADYLLLPALNAFKLPDAITDDIASILDPLGNATHTALSFDLVGEDVLITGAGPIGCMAAAICRFTGARHIVVTDVNPYRLELAQAMGASRVVDVRREKLGDIQRELGMKEGFDVGLEMSGSGDAFQDMLRQMHHGGRVALLGIPPKNTAIDWDDVIFKGLVLKGIYGREMFETWYKMASMIESGLDVSPILTHRMPVAEYEEGFEVMRTGRSGKVILDWAATR